MDCSEVVELFKCLLSFLRPTFAPALSAGRLLHHEPNLDVLPPAFRLLRGVDGECCADILRVFRSVFRNESFMRDACGGPVGLSLLADPPRINSRSPASTRGNQVCGVNMCMG